MKTSLKIDYSYKAIITFHRFIVNVALIVRRFTSTCGRGESVYKSCDTANVRAKPGSASLWLTVE